MQLHPSVDRFDKYEYFIDSVSERPYCYHRNCSLSYIEFHFWELIDIAIKER